MASYSGDSILSPLKTHVTNTSNPGESVHTVAVDDVDCQSKGSYETACDKRVAELQKMFKPVQEAAEALSVLFLSTLLSCCGFSLTHSSKSKMFHVLLGLPWFV